MVRIKIIFFAQLRDLFESDAKEIEIEDGATIKNAASSLLDKRGQRPFFRGDENDKKGAVPFYLPLRFAVNECFEEGDRVLHDGDVLAVMTPMAGG